MKRIVILGSTGSIGTSTLRVVEHLGDAVEVVALVAYKNVDALEEQALKFNPKFVALLDPSAANELKGRSSGIPVLSGMDAVCDLVVRDDVDCVVSALVGTGGLRPTLAAVAAGKDVALANKEALVSGGAILMSTAQASGANILPVDSEHSALFQCLDGKNFAEIDRLLLTASGGPFKDYSRERMTEITLKQALKHPTWAMGAKNTIDSSTLMNKGLELIEARWLFDVSVDKLEVVVHPQSIVHSMVEFCDGSMIAQLSEPSMVLPIQYALTYPKRAQRLIPRFDFTEMRRLDFFPPDFMRFPCLNLAYEAMKQENSMACFMNAANEVLVGRFLHEDIRWVDIALYLEKLMERHSPVALETVDDILEIDEQARSVAESVT